VARVPDNAGMAMNKRPKGLGMGLDALLGPSGAALTLPPAAAGSTGGASTGASEHARGGVAAAVEPRLPTSLNVGRLRAGRYQPRTRMDEGSLWELAQSIKSQGIMQPILVRPLPSLAGEEAPFEIIAGERRFRAAQMAGLDEVPVLVKAVPDESAAVMALIENIQREDLNPLEEAQGLRRLVDEFSLTHEQAAQAVGRSRSAASNLLRLLNLSEPVQKLLMAGDLDMGHARALLGLQGAEQILVANQIVARRLSVRDAEKLVINRNASDGRASDGPLAARPPQAGATGGAAKSRDIVRLEEQLADKLAATVDIRLRGRTKSAGEVAIAFSSLDALQGVLQKLGLDVDA
jgi:ParB family transcriptional regulator, chromosome partitioning protein